MGLPRRGAPQAAPKKSHKKGAGLLAQGLPAFEAAALAAFLHGEAGDRLAERTGPVGALAGDLLAEIPAACEALRQATAEALDAPESGAGFTLRFPRP